MPTKTAFITQTGTSSFTVPADFGSLVSIEAIGGGGGGRNQNSSGGSGGGAYAKSTYSNHLAPGVVLRAFVGAGINSSVFPANGQASFLVNDSPNFEYVLADFGRASAGASGGVGGSVLNCRGSGPFYAGGTGGNGAGSFGKGGGGGAGGPGGNGGNGGIGTGTNENFASGGGGGAGATLTSGGGAGASGSTGIGGAGGSNGVGNPGGQGAVASTLTPGTKPIGNGGGGGGARQSVPSTFLSAGGGGDGLALWTSGDGRTACPGGGSGGQSTSAGSNINGGAYGGGSGGGTSQAVSGQGIIVFTYNVAATASSTPYSVGQSGVANFVNTTSSSVTNVVANNGLGSYSPVVIGSGGAANITATISANQAGVQINVVDIAGYKVGISNITITVNAGVNLYSTSPTVPALLIYGANTGDTVTLINNGNITGYGGDGGFIAIPGTGPISILPKVGGLALSVVSDITLINNGNIGGGGGGGGGGASSSSGKPTVGGGGGAGGGYGSVGVQFGGIGRTISFTNPGPNGVAYSYDSCCSSATYYGGGDGGYIIATPTGGALGTVADDIVGRGGNAGGSGATNGIGTYTANNNGGGTGNAPTPTFTASNAGGGGGGFGGSGASGYGSASFTNGQVGAVGGYAIVKNGKTVTISGSGNIYGTQLP